MISLNAFNTSHSTALPIQLFPKLEEKGMLWHPSMKSLEKKNHGLTSDLLTFDFKCKKKRGNNSHQNSFI